MTTLVNIIDCEASCWSHHKKDESEIIEIGITVVDVKYLTIKSTDSIIVRPTLSKISEYCTNLTGLTQPIVDDGISFKEACQLLRKKYASTDRIWGSWGNYDKHIFEDQSSLEEVPYPFGHVTHLNIKTLFKIFRGLDREVDMVKALNMLNLYHIGTHHKGSDDSYNIACIFLDMLKHMKY